MSKARVNCNHLAPAKTHLAALPKAEVRLAQSDDGRWMWAVSFSSSSWGFGYAPLPKWGKFADTRAAALAAGVAELLAELCKTQHDKKPTAVIAWLESLHVSAEPAQMELFV